ncbi:class I SAM-dependent DNA methyltransferase [Roseimarinus sediminis]|uniref:class I SAM-dependent DNA methyltransferase n=1 Tax=Roseimarinus sediminis TaxID=1610899 RepID=UPI003D1E1EF9
MGNSFDSKAAGWDDNPKRIKLVDKVWEVLDRQIDFSGIKSAMDYGCGTGLLGFKFIDKVSSLTFCDTSEGMLAQVEKKSAYYGTKNARLLKADLSTAPLPADRFDLIASMLVLHHVEHPGELLARFHQMLNDDGLFCWIDLEEEDGSFHTDSEEIHHHGFSREQVSGYMKDNGFVVNFYSDELYVEKEKDGQTVHYPLYIAIGRKA